jgi:hypothetical protein
MDVRFCEGRDHSREAPDARAKDLDQTVRALASAPGHVCFSLTEDLHGCRQAEIPVVYRFLMHWVCRECALFRRIIRFLNSAIGRSTDYPSP